MMEANFSQNWKISFLCFLTFSAIPRTVMSDPCADGNPRSVCSDCFSKLKCNGGGAPTLLLCSSTARCQEIGNDATCANEDLVPKCKCPAEVPSIIPDAYDNQKYIVCNPDGAQIGSCKPNYFNPTTGTCDSSPPTTTTLAPTTQPCGNTIEIIPVNCTFYQLCTPGSPPTLYECPSGYYFDPNTLQCEKYDSFSCSDYSEDNLYPDPYNCSLYHFCSGGHEMGPPLICPEGEVFDPSTTTCEKDDGSVTCLSDCK